MKKIALLLSVFVFMGGCAPTYPPPKAIYAVAKQDRYSGINAGRNFFRLGETPCVKISGYGYSAFSYWLYKEGTLESVDSGNITSSGNNEVLTCWHNLPPGSYTFQIYDGFGAFVSTIAFAIGQ